MSLPTNAVARLKRSPAFDVGIRPDASMFVQHCLQLIPVHTGRIKSVATILKVKKQVAHYAHSSVLVGIARSRT